ncbi:hypothetical protein ACIRG5_44345 [Lentzea sp. NPDC102401]|uniref:hypothetical protein n=1 Tax=Lentzea sp. NPDC102401 TaxID=3364128 RepID=UPI0037FB9EAD
MRCSRSQAWPTVHRQRVDSSAVTWNRNDPAGRFFIGAAESGVPRLVFVLGDDA